MSDKALPGAAERPRARHYAALLVGNFALALGPFWVRLADSGPVSAGFWRLTLALPLLFLLARANRQPVFALPKAALLVVLAAGVAFALDLAAWHVGIERTRLANATLFGNSGSLILMVWGLVAAHRAPRGNELLALTAALVGSAILLGRSLDVGTKTLAGDLFSVLAGVFYAIYILLLQNARSRLGNWSLLALSSLLGAPVILGVAVLMGEPVLPSSLAGWWPLLALALTSQIIGQGMLVYSLKHFPPLIIGITLLTQPSVAVLAGWLAFGETIGWIDAFGMVLVAAALVIARSRSG